MKKIVSGFIAGAMVCLLATTPNVASASDMQADVGSGLGGNYFLRGVALTTQGQSDNGLQMMAASVAMQPDNMYRSTYLALFLDLPSYNWNVPLFESLHQVAPTNIPVIEHLGKLYEGKQRYAEAEALYTQWANLRPDLPEPYARLGEHYYFTQQYKKGIKAFQRHLELVGDSDYALRQMVRIYKESGDERAAKRLMRQLEARNATGPTFAKK